MSTLEGMDERISAAGVAYEQAVFSGDHTGLAEAERSLDAVEADVALAPERLLHARFLRDRARIRGNSRCSSAPPSCTSRPETSAAKARRSFGSRASTR